MSHYSKKLKIYSKNNKSLTKRRFRRKKSIRNKKLYGGLGEERKLDFNDFVVMECSLSRAKLNFFNHISIL